MQYTFIVVFLIALVAGCSSRSPTGPPPGGLSKADENDATIQRMARFAVSEVGSDYNLLSVTKAQTQVVAGTMYHMTVEVERTYPLGNTKTYTCKVKVLSQTWMDLTELVEYRCRKPL